MNTKNVFILLVVFALLLTSTPNAQANQPHTVFLPAIHTAEPPSVAEGVILDSTYSYDTTGRLHVTGRAWNIYFLPLIPEITVNIYDRNGAVVSTVRQSLPIQAAGAIFPFDISIVQGLQPYAGLASYKIDMLLEVQW